MASKAGEIKRFFHSIFGLSTRQKLEIADHAMLILDEIGGNSEFAIGKSAKIHGVLLSKKEIDWIKLEMIKRV